MFTIPLAPSSEPIIIQMPPSSAPWWGVPLITAAAVLFGALIAYYSTFISDKRKRRADDRRQWDKEIRDLYLQVSRQCDLLEEARRNWKGWEGTSKEDNDQYLKIRLVEDKLRLIANNFELIAEPKTVEAADGLVESVYVFANFLHDRMFDKQKYNNIHDARLELLDCVKVNLRTKPKKILPRKKR